MWEKIKMWILRHRSDILIVLILVLTILAAFQMGRLSILYGRPAEFRIMESAIHYELPTMNYS